MKKRTGLRITRVYTRTGDAGKTRLAGGQQVWKDDLRVEAYGTVDELNATIGVVRAFHAGARGQGAAAAKLDAELQWIQNKLFDLGGILATVPGQVFPNMPQVSAQDVTRLERLIDRCQKDLPPLKEFILPGGGRVPSLLHQARTICRRVERVCVRLSRGDTVDGVLIAFLNRLSDALFVLARWVGKRSREPELLWKRET
ncbi:MAG TPA: cob(I)yrinic acid a,c-diamide adenosyltransferase [Nitrospiraceae bacterium]|nr:cob(I)yrinic acid a,c-diamide adenosyltransferase [Nitrospiraceae bacterium]